MYPIKSRESDSPNVHWPAEWEPQRAVLLAWPAPDHDFAPWLANVEHTYGQIAAAISQRQRLIVLCSDEAVVKHCTAKLHTVPVNWTNVGLVPIPYNDVWVRDTAPLGVRGESGFYLANFRFNGWGGKYDCEYDRQLGHRIAAINDFGGCQTAHFDLILEGGSIETDGHGTVLTTSRCLLNPNRNPQLNRFEIELKLRESLGATRILWLDHGHVAGDDTDSHIDTLARFCDAETIAYTACESLDDPQYSELHLMAAELARLQSVSGQPYRLIPLPIPKPIYDESGRRLGATYANFLIINGAVLVPAYGDPDADSKALERLAECFPERQIIPIDCLPLIHQNGSLHCMTMHYPT